MVAFFPPLALISQKVFPELTPCPPPASRFSPNTGADVIITYYTPQLLQWLKE